MRLSERVTTLTPSSTLAITAKANELKKQGLNVIGFGAGEPDFNTPEHILEAANAAMRKGYTKYTPAAGIPELKQAIIKKFKDDNGLTYQTNEVIVNSGAKHALYNIFQVLCNDGDEVIIPIPYWVSYPEQVKLAGGVPVYIVGEESNEFKITPKQLEEAITPKTRLIIINSPSNPTGTVYGREELLALAEICLRNNILIISDEIYEKLVYGDKAHVSIASLSPEIFANTIVVNGVSKPYSMTGWRIGYAATPHTEIIKAMTDLTSHSTSNPTSIAQYASLAAIQETQEPLMKMKQQFELRRNRLMELINAIPGLSCPTPRGAFYAFVNVRKAVDNSSRSFKDVDDWATALLEEAQVAVVPGSGFGAPDHIRLSYATSMENIEEGMRRIQDFVTKYSAVKS